MCPAWLLAAIKLGEKLFLLFECLFVDGTHCCQLSHTGNHRLVSISFLSSFVDPKWLTKMCPSIEKFRSATVWETNSRKILKFWISRACFISGTGSVLQSTYTDTVGFRGVLVSIWNKKKDGKWAGRWRWWWQGFCLLTHGPLSVPSCRRDLPHILNSSSSSSSCASCCIVPSTRFERGGRGSCWTRERWGGSTFFLKRYWIVYTHGGRVGRLGPSCRQVSINNSNEPPLSIPLFV